MIAVHNSNGAQYFIAKEAAGHAHEIIGQHQCQLRNTNTTNNTRTPTNTTTNRTLIGVESNEEDFTTSNGDWL